MTPSVLSGRSAPLHQPISGARDEVPISAWHRNDKTGLYCRNLTPPEALEAKRHAASSRRRRFRRSIIAERLASQRDEKVLVIDRRHHIGGNAYDRYDKAGILIHQYGPNIFDTNSKAVFDHLWHFTEGRSFVPPPPPLVGGMPGATPKNLVPHH